MRWIAKETAPPQYIWRDDEWFNETDKKVYKPNFYKGCWECEDKIIPFPKKTRIIKS